MIKNTKSTCLKVSELNQLIKTILETDIFLSNIWVTGEISNLKIYHQKQQIYFNLIDKNSCINCVIFSNFQDNIKCKLENGIQIIALGKITCYSKRGSYNYQIAYLTSAGQGKQNQEFEKLKKQLTTEGLFDIQHKKSIPKYPQSIGLVTAYQSAAMSDFISICTQSASNIAIEIAPATMQGVFSPPSIIDALERLKNRNNDCVCIVRGGGSKEDLTPYNDENLVRYLFAYPKPIISAIGHEIDYSLVDFVADKRCETPTAAAHCVSVPTKELRTHIATQCKLHLNTLQTTFNTLFITLNHSTNTLVQHMNGTQNELTKKIQILQKRLDLANPLHKFKQGFSIIRNKKTKKVITSIENINKSEIIEIELLDGKLECQVI